MAARDVANNYFDAWNRRDPELVVATFAEGGTYEDPTTGGQAGGPAIGRAEAIRRSMMAMMEAEGNDHFAHPMFWAPFVVVGEGGTPM